MHDMAWNENSSRRETEELAATSLSNAVRPAMLSWTGWVQSLRHDAPRARRSATSRALPPVFDGRGERGAESMRPHR